MNAMPEPTSDANLREIHKRHVVRTRRLRWFFGLTAAYVVGTMGALLWPNTPTKAFMVITAVAYLVFQLYWVFRDIREEEQRITWRHWNG